MERRQSQQERRIPSASSKPEIANDRRTARSSEKSVWQSRTNNKRGDSRTSGGSRYADKRIPVKGASGRGRRPVGRKRRHRNRQLLIILFLLVLIVCLAAGIVLVHSRKKRSDQAQAESQVQKLQKTVDLSMLVSPYAILLDGESGSVLASKRGDEKIFPASMVKVMTVLTAIRSISDLDATTTMSAGVCCGI